MSFPPCNQADLNTQGVKIGPYEVFTRIYASCPANVQGQLLPEQIAIDASLSAPTHTWSVTNVKDDGSIAVTQGAAGSSGTANIDQSVWGA